MTARHASDWGLGSSLWMTTGEAARMLQLSPWGVRWLAREGRLQSSRTVFGRWLFRKADVLALVEQRARARIRTAAAVWRSLRLVPRGEPKQLALPLYRADTKRKIRVLLPEAVGPRRMAKAELSRPRQAVAADRRRA